MATTTNERKLTQKVFETYLLDLIQKGDLGLTITTETIRDAFEAEVFTAMFGSEGKAVLDEQSDLDVRKFRTCYRTLQGKWGSFAKATSSMPAGPSSTMVMGSEPGLPDMTLTSLLDWADMSGLFNPPAPPPAPVPDPFPPAPPPLPEPEVIDTVGENADRKSEPAPEDDMAALKKRNKAVLIIGALMFLCMSGVFIILMKGASNKKALAAKQASIASASVASKAAPAPVASAPAAETAAESPAPSAPAAPTNVAETPAPAEVPAPIAKPKPIGPEEITVTCENRRLPKNCRMVGNELTLRKDDCYQDSFMPTEPLRFVCNNGLAYVSKSAMELIAPGEAVEVALTLEK